MAWADSGEVAASFAAVSGINPEVTVAEHRAGAAQAGDGKMPLPRHGASVTLKRGMITADACLRWIHQPNPAAGRRDILIMLREEKGVVIRRWRLHQTLPIKFTAPARSAKGADVAMEELMLLTEGLSVERRPAAARLACDQATFAGVPKRRDNSSSKPWASIRRASG